MDIATASTSVSNLARHIQSHFFLCQDTRDYLGRIYASAKKNKSTVVLKINSVATSTIHRSVLAFSGVEGLYTNPSTDTNNRCQLTTIKENKEEEEEGKNDTAVGRAGHA